MCFWPFFSQFQLQNQQISKMVLESNTINSLQTWSAFYSPYFTACVACKNLFLNRQKIKFVQLDFSNQEFHNSSTDQHGFLGIIPLPKTILSVPHYQKYVNLCKIGSLGRCQQAIARLFSPLCLLTHEKRIAWWHELRERKNSSPQNEDQQLPLA